MSYPTSPSTVFTMGIARDPPVSLGVSRVGMLLRCFGAPTPFYAVSGAAVRLPADSHAVLHIRHYRHAGK